MRVSLSDWLALQARIRGFKNPRLLRDRPSDGAALRQNLCGVYRHCVQVTARIWKGIWGSPARIQGCGAYMAARFCETMRGTPHSKRGIFGFMRQWVTRVSLSDWLAFQTRIRGSKDPRLLRDRPSDGAALRRKSCGFLLRWRLFYA